MSTFEKFLILGAKLSYQKEDNIKWMLIGTFIGLIGMLVMKANKIGE